MYSEKPATEGDEPEETGELKEVKYKREEESRSHDEQEAPKIEEIKSESAPESAETSAGTPAPSDAPAPLSRAEKRLVFDEGVFSEQEEFAFLLLNVKGYSEERSRFYLSSGYLFVEVERDDEIRRSSFLLENEAVPEQAVSSVQLLVDFIAVKMKKKTPGKWGRVGEPVHDCVNSEERVEVFFAREDMRAAGSFISNFV